MNNLIVVHNVETNEIVEREMTADELAQLKIDKAVLDAEIKEVAKRAADKAALLEKLGITEDEAKLLLS